MRRPDLPALVAAAMLVGVPPAGAQQVHVPVSLRGYTFLRVADTAAEDAGRRDAEFAAVRVAPEVSFGSHFKAEAHVVLDFTSPPGSPAAVLATGTSPTDGYLPLQREVRRGADSSVGGYLDRLNARLRGSRGELVVGRQAITWGVNLFWPALDLFAPFAPTRVDRDYKRGVDAVRLTLPLGDRTEFQAVGAVLGESRRRDAAGAGLLRVSAGRADGGIMAGSFRGDTVAGGFLSADLRGTVVRAEAAWTRPGDELERSRRPSFWRGGIGLERQLSRTVNVVAEIAGNGYGESDPSRYLPVLQSERARRGEAGGVGRWYAGTMARWQFHPLWTLTNTLLVNCSDRSSVWLPWLTWSISGGADLLVGAQFAFGADAGPAGVPRSEFGGTSTRIAAGLKVYM